MDSFNIPMSDAHSQILQKEIARINASRPIIAKGTGEIFLILSRIFQEQGFPECNIQDLFYGGCIFLGEIFAKVPDDPRFPKKSSRQVIEPMLYVAKESMNFGGSWLAKEYLSYEQDIVDCDFHQLGSLRRRFFEVRNLLGNLGLNMTLLFKKDEDISLKMEMFKKIEFLLRKNFNHLIENQISDLQPIYSRDIELGLFQGNMSQMGCLASIGSWILQIPLSQFMKEGIEKIESMT